MTISEEELADHSFSERDGIFVTDAVQVEFMAAKSNSSLAQSWAIPLSTHAYASLLKFGHRKVRSYFQFIDFAECQQWYGKLGFDHSRTWLKELGLEFQIEGIDIAELDAMCQFLLFNLAAYIAGTAERLIRTCLEIETFYVIEAENPLPLDFYFDSDVPAAVLYFVCERLDRRVRTIRLKERPRFVLPTFRRRPITSSLANRPTDDQATFRIPRFSRQAIGFVPATIRNPAQILSTMRKLGSSVVIFPSIWGTAPISSSCLQEGHYVFHLSDSNGESRSAVTARLADLRKQFVQVRAISTLPDCIIANPYLDFQFEYIFTRRWLSYANMISRAIRFVAETPLDLFIQSDAFTAEGAILARLYRRTPTRIAVALHSGWPGERSGVSWTPSDSAIVPSNSCADRIRELSGMTSVFVTGAQERQTFRSLVHPPTLPAKKRSIAAHRQIVLIITNASELNCVPHVAFDSYFRTLACFRQIPASLQDRILVAVRTKPGLLGDDPILYRELCGFPAESLTFLDGLDFPQSVEVADCVVGFNLPTTGYFDVLRKGVPLIHVQTADVVVMHPDLSPEVVPRINKVQDIWPAIEAILFDARHRQQLLEIQQRFVADDFTPTVSGDGDPIECVIRQLLGDRSSWSLGNFLGDLWHRSASQVWRGHRPSALVESCLPLSQKGGAGYVDDILLGSDGTTLILGWAADISANRPAKAIHVFLTGVCVGAGTVEHPRPDVAAYYHNECLEPSGFSIHLTSVKEEEATKLSIYAELHDKTFFKLQMPNLPK